MGVSLNATAGEVDGRADAGAVEAALGTGSASGRRDGGVAGTPTLGRRIR
jgi:hypothetical protein